MASNNYEERKRIGKLAYTKSKEKLRIHREKQKTIAKNKCKGRSCKQCGNLLKYEQRRNKFCSRSCARLYWNIFLHWGSENRRRGLSKGVVRLCKSGKTILQISKRMGIAKDTVSKILKENNIVLRNIETVPWERIGTPKRRKHKLIFERGRRCQSCKLKLWRKKPIPLEIHHVDGNNNNNQKSNVRLLCPNCHSFTPSYKSRNIVFKKRRGIIQ